MSNLQTTLTDVQQTVNRIEQIARSLYNLKHTDDSSGIPMPHGHGHIPTSNTYPSPAQQSSSTPLRRPYARDSFYTSSLRGPARRGTDFSDAATIVVGNPAEFCASPTGSQQSVHVVPPPPDGMPGPSTITSTTAHISHDAHTHPLGAAETPEWVTWLHERFSRAMDRSVGLEHTKVSTVLDQVVKWLEEVRAITHPHHNLPHITYINIYYI